MTTHAPLTSELANSVTKLTTIIAAFLISVLALFNPTTASAAPKGAESAPAPAMLNAAEDTAQRAIESARSVLESLPHGAVADMKNAHVSQPEGTNNLMVAVQLSGEGYDEGSFAGVVVNPDNGRTSDLVQVKAEHDEGSNARVTTWVNGDSQGTTTVDTSGDAASSDATPAGVNPDVLDCLNALGISTAVALIIISTCASACVASHASQDSLRSEVQVSASA